MKKTLKMLKNIFTKIKFFICRIKSPFLALLLIIDLITFLYYRGKENVGIAFLIMLSTSFVLTVSNEIFRKKSFINIILLTAFSIPKIIFELYFVFLWYSKVATIDSFGRLIQDKLLMGIILPMIFFILLDLIVSVIEIFRTNQVKTPVSDKIKKETSSTISLLLILFSGLTYIFTLYVVFLTTAQTKFYPMSTTMGFTIVAFIISLLALLISKKGKVGIILYLTTLLALFSLSCTMLVFDIEFTYFAPNVIMIFSSLYLSNILFTIGCLFFRGKEKIENIEKTN